MLSIQYIISCISELSENLFITLVCECPSYVSIVAALSTSTVLASQLSTDFKSNFLYFHENSSKLCCIDTYFFNMCHKLKKNV